MSALATPGAHTAPSPLLGRHVAHAEHGVGLVTFRSDDRTPVYGLTWSDAPTTYGTAIVLLERGVKLLPGRSELPLFPARVNDMPDLTGLGSCEHAARRELAGLRLGRAA